MWWKDAVIYEVYVDKFAQNFRGLTGKFDYLKKLGINCIWLLPHYPSPMIDDGYDVSDYRNVRPELGTLEDFRKFTAKAHELGIRIVIDFVLNHVSTEHSWFREHPEYFIRSNTGKEFSEAINAFSHLKKSNWIPSPETGDYYFATFYPQQADLNWEKPEVFDAMMKTMDFWIDQGVDGFRLDAVPYLVKREGTACANLPETHEVVRKIRAHVEAKNPEVMLLAETNGTPQEIESYLNDKECHMAFNFHLMSNIYSALMRGDRTIAEEAAKTLADIPSTCQWATFLRNHDELTLAHVSDDERETLLAWLDPDKKYSFEGGAGTSVRLATIFKGDKKKVLEAFELLFSLPGAPVIYYGDEIGMENLALAERPVDTRRYVRGDFDWQEAEKQAQDPDSILSGVSKLAMTKTTAEVPVEAPQPAIDQPVPELVPQM